MRMGRKCNRRTLQWSPRPLWPLAAGCEISKTQSFTDAAAPVLDSYVRFAVTEMCIVCSSMGFSSIAHIKRFAFFPLHSLSCSRFFGTILHYSRLYVCVCVLLFQFLFLRLILSKPYASCHFFVHLHHARAARPQELLHSIQMQRASQFTIGKYI